jgi:hypothetical protein
MDSSPFDLDDVRLRPTSPIPIPSELVRVSFAEVEVGKVYYLKFIYGPDRFDWTLSQVSDDTGSGKVRFGRVWYFGSMNHWSPLLDSLNLTPADIDTDIPDGTYEVRHHLYAPRPNPAPKPAPSGLSQRKTRRNNSRSRSRRTNRSRRTRTV